MFEDCGVVVTGGAGFIGGYLTEELLNRNCRVTVIDNFSAGTMKNIHHLAKSPLLKIVKEDLKNPRRLGKTVAENGVIFHLAANPEVRAKYSSKQAVARAGSSANLRMIKHF